MTKKKILIFYDNNNPEEIDNFTFLLKSLNYDKYQIDLIITENLKIKTPKPINIIKFKLPKNKINQFFLKQKIKYTYSNKYDCSVLHSINSLIGNYCVKKSSKNRILIADLKEEKLEDIDAYRKYFIDRNIYDFEHIIFKNYQELEKFLKLYPSLSKKTSVINDLINYVEIEKSSKEPTPEKIKRTDINLLLIEELNEEKNNILEKLKLIKELKNDIPNIKLFIIGDGIDKYAYETFIEDNKLEDTINLLGNKKNIFPYIKKCKYVLLNNRKSLKQYLYPCIILKKHVISTIDYSDDNVSLDINFGFRTSKNIKIYKKEITNFLKNMKTQKRILDFNKINKEKIEKIEKIVCNKE